MTQPGPLLAAAVLRGVGNGNGKKGGALPIQGICFGSQWDVSQHERQLNPNLTQLAQDFAGVLADQAQG